MSTATTGTAGTMLGRMLRPAPDSMAGCAMRRGRPAWSEYVHVVWSIWVFIVPVFTPDGYDRRWTTLTLVSYPLFLALYTASVLAPARRVAIFALGLAALCLVLVPWYPAGMSYFMFGCIFLGMARWRSWWGYPLALLALNALFVAVTRYFGYPWSAMVWMPFTSLAVGLVVQLQRVLEGKEQALQLSQDEVRRLATTAERERIGRDLHDLLGHTLSLVALKADLAGKLLERDPAAARREIDELGGVARQALSQVRKAVSGIRSAQFAAELAAAGLLLQGEGIRLHLLRNDASQLPPELETALALCLREAVTNVHRHARARNVQVALEVEDGTCRLRVEDDGRGGAIRPGNGLTGMRERIDGLGGRLLLQPASPRGTCVLAEVPLREAAAREPLAPAEPATAQG
ncbi:integral membrane sensor signal transduction histidine kinase [Pseudoxanthomonas suwonensis 11-1]|uniref:Integral membrane sensor signal transduction histidine kinase n=1 Tax=Pseudoxanthomonas suwonensis (strain 11-1) TaxID=743721 RepID=E6WWI2_PSEUU|nr:sensor histidine kinase [Pseudoxanthomonas suwonensis]ADV28459.1 integral membrane sensor signal transduction histidine kinase [Pseudoxanthomonas suwonensis 11-1]